MNSTVHERPGVYSSYDVSSVVSGGGSAKTVGVAALSTSGTANEAVLLHSYADGVEAFGMDSAGAPGMETILRLLFANGAETVRAVRVGKNEDEAPDYASAFAALESEEDIGILVCDSAETGVQQSMKASIESAVSARRERIAVVGGSDETVAEMVSHAAALNCERMVLVGPDAIAGTGGLSAVFVAAAMAGVIAKERDVSVPVNGAGILGFERMAIRFSDAEIDTLVRGGVTPIETVGGVSSPVRGITTRTTSGGAADATWREVSTILIVDDVISSLRASLRARFARSKNTAQTRGAIRSQVVLELEEKLRCERIDSYGDVSVRANAGDPTVCEVEFAFTVAHGLNRIYLTAHITV